MLTRKDLKPGDIMGQFETGSKAGRAIAFGQKLTVHHHSNIVHAGLLFDNMYMIEALNKGIRARDLRIQNRPFHYLVYRASNLHLAQGAADCANMMLKIHHEQKSMPYTIPGAVASIFGKDRGPKTPAELDKLLDDILAGREHAFFCSQFVVYVYQFVAEQNGLRGGFIFNMSDPKVSPARLMTYLDSSPNFSLVGELPANAR